MIRDSRFFAKKKRLTGYSHRPSIMLVLPEDNTKWLVTDDLCPKITNELKLTKQRNEW